MRRRLAQPAFTLTELIVVMTIILVLLAVSIPTFRSTIAATDSSNAETKLRLALLAGRDAALHSDRGVDTAVVFFFEPFEPGGRNRATRRTYAVICEYAGTIPDQTDRSPDDPVYRDVFVPVATFEPVQLPAGYSLRGFVPAGSRDTDEPWYDGDDRYQVNAREWVFPENAFYDAVATDDGRDRQSFMVRFHGGVGAVALGDSREALVLDPRPTAAGRGDDPWSYFRVDVAADPATVVRRAINRLNNQSGPGAGGVILTRLFGDESGDTVLCRTVDQLVLYKEAEAAAAVGARLDPDTGSLYRAKRGNRDDYQPEFIPRFSSADLQRYRQWLEGDTNFNGDWVDDDATNPDRPIARLYTFGRYSAALHAVPLIDLEQLGAKPAGGGS